MDKRRNYGVSYHVNGSKYYEGFWNENNFQGKGKIYDENGNLEIDGFFSKNSRNSYFKGKKYSPINGCVIFEGELLEDEKYGVGKAYYDKNGQLKYEGSYENGQKSGYGTLYHLNGNLKYVGCFKENHFHGIGEKFDFSGKLICRGKWSYGEIERLLLTDEQCYQGLGVLDLEDEEGYDSDGENECYIGTIEDGKRHGYGAIFSKTLGIKILEGNFQHNKLNGFYKTYHTDNEFDIKIKYIGIAINDKANGRGCLYHENGKLWYRGLFLDGDANDWKFHTEYLENGIPDIEENYAGRNCNILGE